MSEPYWVPLSGTPTKTIRQPIQLANPQSAANPGNAFPAVAALTAWEAWHWEFLKDVDSRIFGKVEVPFNIIAGSTAKIVLVLAANATSGVTRMSVAHAGVADGASLNPASLTAIASQDITVPATARLRKDVSFTLAALPTSGDELIVSVYHEGAHANDTLAVNTELYAALLEVTVA